MSGPGRRRKPNPDEEGSLPPPPGPPAGYPQQAQQQPEQGYAYDWRQMPASQSDVPPGPVFDAFSSPPYSSSPSPAPSPYSSSPSSSLPPPPTRPRPGSEQSSYYNPVGYGLHDPYAATSYAPPQSQPTQPSPPSPSSSPPPPAPYPAASTPWATQPPYTQTQPDSAQRDAASFPHQAAPPSSAAPPSPSFEPGGLFDEADLFDFDPPSAAASAAPPAPATPPSAVDFSGIGANPVVPPPPDGAPRPNDGYAPADFAFLEEETGQDVKGWLTFVESRADSRADRIRRFRVQLIGVGAAIAVVVVAVGAYFLFSGGSAGNGGPTKSVIMLQLSNSTGNAVADALLVTDRTAASGTNSTNSATGKGSAVVIPSHMEVNTTGFGLQPFGGDMTQSVPAAGKETVADTFGVSIDGVWRMDEVTFAGLIDEIGGIKLTANTAVPAVTATPSAAAVQAGPGKLTGGQAVAYGTYAAKGEAPGAQSQRFGQVVAGLLAALPTEAPAITSYLNHLGIVDDPSLPESKLSPILASLATEQQAGAFTAKVLPVRTDGSNEMDVQAAGPIVSSILGGALTAGAPGQVSRVLVEDATGNSGTRSQAVRNAAQAKLSNSGYNFLDGATATQRATSVVEVGSDGQKSAAVQVAETLGLQPNSVQVVSGMSTFADVTVILGADWPNLAGVSLPPATN